MKTPERYICGYGDGMFPDDNGTWVHISDLQAYADESRIEELEWVRGLTESVRLNNLITARIEDLKQLEK